MRVSECVSIKYNDMNKKKDANWRGGAEPSRNELSQAKLDQHSSSGIRMCKRHSYTVIHLEFYLKKL